MLTPPAAPCRSRRESEVDRLAEGAERRLERGFGQGRVGVDRVDDLLQRRLDRPPHGELVDDLRRLRADDVDAQDLARRLVGDHLHEALRIAEGDGLAARRERELPDAHLTAVLPRALFRQAERRDLRAAVGARGHVPVIEGAGLTPRDRLGGHHALRHRLVREQRRPDHVADRVDSRHRRLHPRRDRHEATAETNAERFQPEAGDLRAAADGHQHLLGLQPPGIGLDGHARAPGLHGGHLHAGLHLDGPAPERPRELFRDLLVLEGDQTGERLEDRHLDAVRRINVGELDADRARADHDDGLGRPLVAHGAVRGDHRLLVDGDAGQRLRLGAGREDHRPRLDRLGPARPRHVHGVVPLEDATTRDEGDLVLPEQELDALRHAIGDAAAPLDRLGVARLEARETDTELRGPPEEVDHLGVAQERLGRDAPRVQADAAGPIIFDGRHRQTELGATDRGDVASGPGADDDDVDLHRLASRVALRLRTPITGSPRAGVPAAAPTRSGFALPPARPSRYTRSRSGSSRRRLTSWRNRAPIAPSITRWSQESVSAILHPTPSPASATTGIRRTDPTARIAPSGGLMIAENSATSYIPRFEIENVAPESSGARSFRTRARSARSRASTAIWASDFAWQSRSTGVMSPSSSATAMPMCARCQTRIDSP